MTATLTTEKCPDGKTCAKCRASEKPMHRPVTHVLTVQGKSWPLCGAHAAQACHAHGISHRVFNPTGETSK